MIPQLAGDGQFIVLTHIGPAFSSTSKSYESNGSIIESGSHKLQEILTQNYEKILLNIHGHTHNAEGVFSYGSKLTKVINPGSALYGKYAEITLKYTENSWSIFEINLKQV